MTTPAGHEPSIGRRFLAWIARSRDSSGESGSVTMPMTDRERELLGLLDRYLTSLHGIQHEDPATIDPFGRDDAAAQRWLQLAIQCCLDLGDSLLGRMGEDEPPRLRDIFAALERRGVISAELRTEMERLTDYRNELGHAYARLTPAQTWRRLRDGLPWLAEFAHVLSQLQAEGTEPGG
jgi:uncharacterized protein YutE (UPF0331/DUF86 family)